jgi:hypothetical protein
MSVFHDHKTGPAVVRNLGKLVVQEAVTHKVFALDPEDGFAPRVRRFWFAYRLQVMT